VPAYLKVARKELVEHLRDIRSVLSTALDARSGPAVVMMASFSRVGAATGRFAILVEAQSWLSMVIFIAMLVGISGREVQ
jgi:hypothetical protein